MAREIWQKTDKFHEPTIVRKSPAILPAGSDHRVGEDWCHDDRCRSEEDLEIPEGEEDRQADKDYWTRAKKAPKKAPHCVQVATPPKPNTFPFGKHKGKQIRHIPTHYLDWLLTLNPPLRESLVNSIQKELIKRKRQTLPHKETQVNCRIKPPWIS